MKRLVAAFILLSTLFVRGQSFDLDLKSPAKKNVAVTLISDAAVPGQPFRAAVRLVHEPHFHTYGQKLAPGVTGKPTTVKWTLPEGWKLDEQPWPAPTPFTSFGKASEGFEGTVELPVRITPPAAATTGSFQLKATVEGLVCDDKTCLSFLEEATLNLQMGASTPTSTAPTMAKTEPATPPPAPSPALIESSTPPPPPPPAVVTESTAGATAAPAPPADFWKLLLYALLGGLILNIMPCVFPVLSIKIMSLVQQAGGERREIVKNGLAYTAGVLVSFWVLAIIVVILGKGWGFQLQSPVFVLGLGFFFLAFAMNMAGVFEIGTSAVGVGAELQSKGGIGGSFFTGLLATVVATPCSAPFLAPALAFALSLPLSSALLFFTVIALGLALPFLLLSIFPSLLSRLPRPGVWMESFKQGMSFLLFGTVAYMIYVYNGQSDSEQFFDALLGLVLAAAGCWVYGRWFLPHKKPRTRRIAILMTLLLFIGGFMLAVNSPPPPVWSEWSPKLEQYHRELKEPVYVDFTARWCATCQANKSVYKIPAVKRLIRDKNVVLLRADMTVPDRDIQKALEGYGRAAIPLNVLFIPGREKPIILQGENDELLSEQNVSAALNQIPSK